MGAGTLSKPNDEQPPAIDVDKVKTYSAEEIANVVAGFGSAYEQYTKAVVEHGLTGVKLLETSIDDIPSIVDKLGVTNALHAKKISLFFRSLKERQLGFDQSTRSTASMSSSQASFNDGKRAGSRKIRRTSIGHSVEKQQESGDAIASLQATLASELSVSTPAAGDTASQPKSESKTETTTPPVATPPTTEPSPATESEAEVVPPAASAPASTCPQEPSAAVPETQVPTTVSETPVTAEPPEVFTCKDI